MPDLSTEYLGLRLRTPLVASSSPLTGDLDGLRRLEDAGASAVVLPSLFEEQINDEAMEIDQLLETGAESFAEALSYFPELGDYDTGPDRYLNLVQQAKAALEIPVIASLNGTSPGGWVEHAKLIEEAGADALELNLYLVAADADLDATGLETRYAELVRAVRGAVRIRCSTASTSPTSISTRSRCCPASRSAAPRSSACRCAGSPFCTGAFARRSPRRRASTRPSTSSRCSWPARTSR
jgi:dihydroorotate dehydrogenase (fumarate)